MMEQINENNLEEFRKWNNWSWFTEQNNGMLRYMAFHENTIRQAKAIRLNVTTFEDLVKNISNEAVWKSHRIKKAPLEEDHLVLANSDGSTVTVLAEHQLWRDSLDQYMRNYYLLRKAQIWFEKNEEQQKRNVQENKGIPTKKLPLFLENEIIGWKGNGTKKKTLQVDLAYLLTEDKDKRLHYNEYAVGNALMFQYLCRDLHHRDKAFQVRRSEQYGGAIYVLSEEYQEKLPELKLEDYWLHEYYYGIGLSIEIAAVLFQIQKKYSKKGPWYDHLIEVVLDLFSRHCLPILVESRNYFTRNTLARKILLDVMENVDGFPKGTGSHLSEEAIRAVDDCIRHAEDVLTSLEFQNTRMDIPLESVPEALAHIEALLARVKKPVDILKYVKEPGNGLAVFCNPEHPYVKDYLREMEANIVVKPGEHTIIKSNKKANLFRSVRRYVMDAIQIVRIVSDEKLQNDFVCQMELGNTLPENFMAVYDDLVRKNGGLLLLGRFNPDGLRLVNNMDKEVKPWEVSLDDLQKAIPQEKDTEVSIWELYDMEYLAVMVPPKKCNVVLPPIDPNLLY